MNVSEQLNDTSKFSNCIHSRENLLEKLPVIFIKLNASLLKYVKYLSHYVHFVAAIFLRQT